MSSNTQHYLEIGTKAFQQGDFVEAERCGQKVLQLQPGDFNALQLAGTAAYNLQKYTTALELIQKAIALNAEHAELFHTLGCILKDMGRAGEAEINFLQALNLKKDYPPAMTNLAITFMMQQKFSQAIEQLQVIIQLDDSNHFAQLLLGECYEKTGQTQAAIAVYEAALQQSPDDVTTNLKLANIMAGIGEFSIAEAGYRKVLSITPNHSVALLNLGNIAFEQEHFDEAVQLYQTVLQHYRGDPSALNALGEIHERRGDLHQARVHFLKALEHTETSPAETLVNLGRLSMTEGDNDNCQHYCAKALEADPNCIRAYITLSLMEDRQGNKQAAEQYLHQALQINNQHTKAWYNLGVLYQTEGRSEDAITCYRNTLLINPHYDNAAFNLGTTLLRTGQFEEGWHHYFQRPRLMSDKIKLSPFTPGENFKDKKILLIHAQGIGDELMFLRFATLLHQQGAKLSYLSSPKLLPLLKNIDILEDVFDEVNNIEDFDAIFAVDDLPLITGATSAEDIPPPLSLNKPHLTVLEKSADTPYIGITWRAGAAPADVKVDNIFMLTKEVPLDQMMKMIPGDAMLIVLQRNPLPEEIATLERHFPGQVLDMSELNDDLEKMLALLSQLDDVIGVSNTNMHLLASLNKTANVLIPWPADWRWPEGYEQSPWFPGFRTLRQQQDRSWPQIQLN